MTNATDKHTPGPWRIVPGGGHAHNRIVGSDSIQVNGWPAPRGGIANAGYSDRVCENLGNLDLPGPAANAALIAAAPDLLALALQYASECATCGGTGLVTIYDYDGNGSDADDQPCHDCANIRAAILKATDIEGAQ